ncbi:ribokinase [Wenxinia marina]|uniref:Ribokinase n=1 Tax=Wenxinia marina DSM 24838 TaxID=1123501 RepID=A0A0D0NS34_9RHOB|nr:ribokinase [Wenxinia marina]KIQ71045.1 Sugar kinase, ribokinase family [Wenxinia marina DSM 24838]GGL55329.1 ribokinase [Wenxinia marina]
MAVWNLGSINADIVFAVPRIPAPGETLASRGRSLYLGGKGANMSVAAARAGAHAVHVGAVGADGRWAVEQLTEWGVDTRFVRVLDEDTGQAIILVDDDGENAIVLHPGANRAIPAALVEEALSGAATGDWFVCQNETNGLAEAAKLAKAMGLKVAHAAAPFEAEAVTPLLPSLDLLVLNAVEAAQLAEATGRALGELGVADVIVTLGGDGSEWHHGARTERFAPVKVEPVDTTGAGDTFTGYLLASLDRGMAMDEALRLASHAGALMVTRKGTADVIPDLAEVLAFRKERGT